MVVDLTEWTARRDGNRALRLAGLLSKHLWFAWYPVQVKYGKYVWLETVVRQYANAAPYCLFGVELPEYELRRTKS